MGVNPSQAKTHFDHQVKEARLSYAERQQLSTKSTLQHPHYVKNI